MAGGRKMAKGLKGSLLFGMTPDPFFDGRWRSVAIARLFEGLVDEGEDVFERSVAFD